MVRVMTKRDNLATELAQSTQDLDLIRQADILALDQASEIYSYNFHRTASTLVFAGRLYEAAKASGLLPEAEAGLRELTREYVCTARSITHLANTEILLSMGHALTAHMNGNDNDGATPSFNLKP